MNLFRRPLHIFAAAALVFGASAIAQQTPPKPVPNVPAPAAMQVPVPPPPDVDATAWVLMDYATGQVLASKNPDQRVVPASITKVMTDYVISAQIGSGKIHLTDQVSISAQAVPARTVPPASSSSTARCR
jgi:D-alanyl-D-alanine carboxypeptidase (penicillin-binding protein 5/6)